MGWSQAGSLTVDADTVFMSSIKQLSFSPSFTFVLVKQRAASAAPVSRPGKQASNSKTGDAHGRSRSLNRNGSDASGGSLGGQQATRQASGPAPAGVRLCSSRSFSSLHTSALSTAPFMRSSRSLTRLDRSSTTDGIIQIPPARFDGNKITISNHECGKQKNVFSASQCKISLKILYFPYKSTGLDGDSNLQVRTGIGIEKTACGSSQLSSSRDDTRFVQFHPYAFK